MSGRNEVVRGVHDIFSCCQGVKLFDFGIYQAEFFLIEYGDDIRDNYHIGVQSSGYDFLQNFSNRSDFRNYLKKISFFTCAHCGKNLFELDKSNKKFIIFYLMYLIRRNKITSAVLRSSCHFWKEEV